MSDAGVMTKEYGEIRQKYVEMIEDAGNENLAGVIETSVASKLASDDFINGLTQSFPEFKSELVALQAEIEKIQDKGVEEYNPYEYFDGNKFITSDLADHIEEDYTFKYVVEEDSDTLYVFEDGIWKPYGASIVKKECQKRLEHEWKDHYSNEVLKMIKARNQIRKTEFTPPKDKIPFKNGVYDLEKDEFRDFEPDFNFTFKYEVDYNPDLENEDVDEFLETIQDTEDKIKKLKEIAGLCLIPDVPIDKAPVLFGKGANGKNQYVKIIRKILGEENAHELDNTDISEDKHATAELEGKQMVFYDEFEDVSKPGKLKHLIGAEMMRVRPTHQVGYMARNRAFPIFAANELPRTKDQSNGFFRRWEIIDFPFQFTKQKDDGHKDLIPERKLEEKYMNQEALTAFATSCVSHLKDVLEDSKLTGEQSTNETRQRWNEKSNPIYSFLDRFVKPGRLPDQSMKGTADYILKEDLKDMINAYIESLNGSKVQTHEVTRALKAHPDLDPQTDYRTKGKDGKQSRAYAGLKLDEANLREIHLYSGLFEKISDYSEYINKNHLKYLEVSETQKEAEALNFLDSRDEPRAKLFDIIKALDLGQEQMADIESSKFIKRETSGDSDSFYPIYVMDREAVDEAIEEADLVLDESGGLKPPIQFIREKLDDVSKETQLEIQELIDDGEDSGYKPEDLESAVKTLTDQGEAFEPKPGKIQKL